MRFEDAYRNVQAGSATAEEKAYVEAELRRVREISDILLGDDVMDDELFDHKFVAEPAERETAEKARKAFNKRNTVKLVGIVLAVLVVVCGVVFGGFAGTAVHNAKQTEELTQEEAVNAAISCVTESYPSLKAADLKVTQVDREMEIRHGVDKAYYYYEIQLEDPNFVEYEVNVNAKSGYAYIDDIDRD